MEGAEALIRLALPEEADEIAGVLRAAFAPFESFYTTEAYAATTPGVEIIRARFDENGAIWAALENEKVIGTVSVVSEVEEGISGGGRLYIRSMAVSPAAQGKGVARKLFAAVENYAVENRFEKLFLYTVPFLTGAIRLYEQRGFERGALETEGFFGTPWFEMEKKLNRQGI